MDMTAANSISASTIFYRKTFHYATRTWDEPIETWYLRLKTLAEPCLFGDMYDAFLLNKFVVDLKDDSPDQLSGINTIDEWTLNSVELALHKEQSDVFFENEIYQVKDEVINEENDNEWCAVNTIEYACVPEETAKKKRKYTRRTGTKKRNEKVTITESGTPTTATEPMTDATPGEPRPKKRQFRTPLKLFCESCPGRNFKYKSNLMQHMERYHIKSKSHICYYCGKSFNVSMELNKHLRTHTGERPFACDICPKKFSRSDKLKQHRDVHEGVKRHICSICNKKYSQAYSLTLHYRSHTGERPYVCKFCNKGFTNSKSLTIHLKTHGIAI